MSMKVDDKPVIQGAGLPGWQKVPVLTQIKAEVVTEPSASTTGTEDIPNGILADKTSTLEYLTRLGQAGESYFKESKQILTFDEYLLEVAKNPTMHMRPASRYVLDSIDYWNKYMGYKPSDRVRVLGHDVRPMAFVQKPWEPEELIDKELVRGQLLFWNDLYDKLEIIARKKHPNRMIIAHGPNATGKSRVFETLFEELENYSKTNEGALYTFNWVFDSHQVLGFGAKEKRDDKPITPEEVEFWLPAGKNSHPLFLLPKEERVALLNALEAEGKLPEDFNKDYIISGEMSGLSRKMFQALWKAYSGNLKEVLNHVHVTRWEISTLSREGAVLIQPAVTPHAVLSPIYPDVDWSRVPLGIANILRTSGLHEIEGDFAQANRGVVAFDDVFKDHDMDEYLHLLRGAEKSRQTIATNRYAHGKRAVDEQFDMLLFGTTNDDTLRTMESDQKEWESLRSRFIFTPMGFERCYRNVADIYKHQLAQMIPKTSTRHIAPRVLESFGLWLTMTYLFPVRNKNYYDNIDMPEGDRERFFPVAKKLSILEKALLYQGEDINSFELDPEHQKYSKSDKELLNKYLGHIVDEYNMGVGRHKFFLYEGSHGLSSRVGEEIFEDAIEKNASTDNCFSVLELFDTLQEWIDHGFEFESERKEFISRAATELKKIDKPGIKAAVLMPSLQEGEGIPSTKSILDQVKGHEKRKIRYDVQIALGTIRNKEEQINTLKKYIAHVKAYTSTTNKTVTPEYRDPPTDDGPNENFMSRIETMFFTDLKKDLIDKFRQQVIQRIGEWMEDGHKGENPFEHIGEIYADLIEKMDAHDMELNKKRLADFLIDLRIYYEKDGNIDNHRVFELEPKRKEFLLSAIDKLTSDEMGYCKKCLPKLIYDFAFKDDLKAIMKERGANI